MKIFRLLTSLSILLCLVLIAGSSTASGQTFEWSGFGVNGFWSDGANWVGGDPPPSDPTTNLSFIDGSQSLFPNQDQPSFSAGNMFIQSDPGSFSFSGGEINIVGGIMTVAGTAPTFMSNDLLFSNGGGINLQNGVRLFYDGTQIGQENQTEVLVSGNGELRLNNLTFLPAHLQVSADVLTVFDTGATVVDVSNGFDSAGDVSLGFTNLNFVSGANIVGNLNSTAGTIGGNFPSTPINVGGTTVVNAEGFLTLKGGTSLTGNGDVFISGAGDLNLEDDTTVQKSMIVEGTVNGEFGANRPIITGSAELRGGTLNGSLFISGGISVTNGQRSVIESNSLIVTGAVDVSDGILEIGSSSQLLSKGSVEVAGGSSLDFQGGEVRANVIIGEGGFLTGTGTIVGDLIVDGILGPGNSAGTIGVSGRVNMVDTTMTCIELGGTKEGEFDKLRQQEATEGMPVATLDGILNISLIDDFVPDAADEFLFIEGFTIEGFFDNADPGGNLMGGFATLETPDGTFQVEYGTDFVKLFSFKASVPEPGTTTLLAALGLLTLARRRRRGGN